VSVIRSAPQFRENIVRYFRPFDHKEPFYIYFYNLPLLFLPWTPLFVAAIVKASTSLKQLDWPRKWLTISTILIFLFFTLSGSRRSYYILPILPFCALMSAIYFEMEKQEKGKQLVLKIQTGLIMAILLVGILSPAIWPVLKIKDEEALRDFLNKKKVKQKFWFHIVNIIVNWLIFFRRRC
jgi:4-amino-4-deoxy-L-arabinose transferase-like glycosyltransferase